MDIYKIENYFVFKVNKKDNRLKYYVYPSFFINYDTPYILTDLTASSFVVTQKGVVRVNKNIPFFQRTKVSRDPITKDFYIDSKKVYESMLVSLTKKRTELFENKYKLISFLFFDASYPYVSIINEEEASLYTSSFYILAALSFTKEYYTFHPVIYVYSRYDYNLDLDIGIYSESVNLHYLFTYIRNDKFFKDRGYISNLDYVLKDEEKNKQVIELMGKVFYGKGFKNKYMVEKDFLQRLKEDLFIQEV